MNYKVFFFISLLGNFLFLVYVTKSNLYFENKISQISKSTDNLINRSTSNSPIEHQKIKRFDLKKHDIEILKDETLALTEEFLSSELSETSNAFEEERYYHFGYILNRFPELNQYQRRHVLHFLLVKKHS